MWPLVVTIGIVAAIPRFYWMLSGQYNTVIVIFILFGLLPFAMITREGRTELGFRRLSIKWGLSAFLIGVITSAAVYLAGYALFRNSELNWYVVIMQTFNKGNLIEQVRPSPLMFIAFSLPVMIFSPVGEEFFFRGMLHEALAKKFGAVGLVADPVFFALTHLAHYGIASKSGTFVLLPSGILWMALMAISAMIFYIVKNRSGSIWGAVICHSGFNFAMMGIIFYVIN